MDEDNSVYNYGAVGGRYITLLPGDVKGGEKISVLDLFQDFDRRKATIAPRDSVYNIYNIHGTSESECSSVSYGIPELHMDMSHNSYGQAFTDTNSDSMRSEPRHSRVRESSSSVGKVPSLASLAAKSLPKYDWNEQFYIIMELPHIDTHEKLARSAALYHLNRCFVTVSSILTKIIVDSERERQMKTEFEPGSRNDDACFIELTDAGGIAGGKKYESCGIFFKLASDHYGVYGGGAYANKAAGHELKGVRALLACDVPNLCVPLVAIIDYRGRRMVAESRLPIKKTSIVYGSDDCGATIHSSNIGMNEKMCLVAKNLNLKPHYIREKKSTRYCLIFGPGDVEGHIGSDGRHYACDLARLLPPVQPGYLSTQYIPSESQKPIAHKWCNWQMEVRSRLCNSEGLGFNRSDSEHYATLVMQRFAEGTLFWKHPRTCDAGKTNQGGTYVNERATRLLGGKIMVCGNAVLVRGIGQVFYNLFREEFMREHCIERRLSSDAYSGFGGHRTCCETDNGQLDEKVGQKHFCPHDSLHHNDEIRIATKLLFQTTIPSFAAKLNSHELSPVDSKELVKYMHEAGINCRCIGFVRRYLKHMHLHAMALSEMIASTVADILRFKMLQECPFLLDEILKIFNYVFGSSQMSSDFWGNKLNDLLTQKYRCALLPQESKAADTNDLDLRRQIKLFYLLLRVQEKSGICIDMSIMDDIFRSDFRFKEDNPFGSSPELIGLRIRPKCKSMEESIIKNIEELIDQIHEDVSSSSAANKSRGMQAAREGARIHDFRLQKHLKSLLKVTTSQSGSRFNFALRRAICNFINKGARCSNVIPKACHAPSQIILGTIIFGVNSKYVAKQYFNKAIRTKTTRFMRDASFVDHAHNGNLESSDKDVMIGLRICHAMRLRLWSNTVLRGITLLGEVYESDRTIEPQFILALFRSALNSTMRIATAHPLAGKLYCKIGFLLSSKMSFQSHRIASCVVTDDRIFAEEKDAMILRHLRKQVHQKFVKWSTNQIGVFFGADASSWSSRVVQIFLLTVLDLPQNIVDAFVALKIDGPLILQLSEGDLLDDMQIIPRLHRLKILCAVGELRSSSNESVEHNTHSDLLHKSHLRRDHEPLLLSWINHIDFGVGMPATEANTIYSRSPDLPQERLSPSRRNSFDMARRTFEEAVVYMKRGYEAYDAFYGELSADFLVPMHHYMFAGHSENMAQMLASMAVRLSSMDGRFFNIDHVQFLRDRILRTMRTLEDVHWHPHNTYYGTAQTQLNAQKTFAAASLRNRKRRNSFSSLVANNVTSQPSDYELNMQHGSSVQKAAKRWVGLTQKSDEERVVPTTENALRIINRFPTFSDRDRDQNELVAKWAWKILSCASGLCECLEAAALTQDDLYHLCANVRAVTCSAGGTVIFEEGDIADSWYVIIRGSVSVSVGNTVVRNMYAKEEFGIMGLMDWFSTPAKKDKPLLHDFQYLRSATVHTLCPTILLRVLHDDIKARHISSENALENINTPLIDDQAVIRPRLTVNTHRQRMDLREACDSLPSSPRVQSRSHSSQLFTSIAGQLSCITLPNPCLGCELECFLMNESSTRSVECSGQHLCGLVTLNDGDSISIHFVAFTEGLYTLRIAEAGDNHTARKQVGSGEAVHNLFVQPALPSPSFTKIVIACEEKFKNAHHLHKLQRDLPLVLHCTVDVNDSFGNATDAFKSFIAAKTLQVADGTARSLDDDNDVIDNCFMVDGATVSSVSSAENLYGRFNLQIAIHAYGLQHVHVTYKGRDILGSPLSVDIQENGFMFK